MEGVKLINTISEVGRQTIFQAINCLQDAILEHLWNETQENAKDYASGWVRPVRQTQKTAKCSCRNIS